MQRFVSAVFAVLVLSSGVARADAGQEIFDKKCATCHGKDGKGDTKMGKERKVGDLTDAAYQKKFTDEEATKAITEGIKEKDSDKKRMPAFGEKLKPEEIKEALKYARTFAK